MKNDKLLKRLNIEIEEKIVYLDDYIYVVKDDSNKITNWYYTDSVEELKEYQNELFESNKSSSTPIPEEAIRHFDKYIEQLAKDKPNLVKMKVKELLNEIQNKQE